MTHEDAAAELWPRFLTKELRGDKERRRLIEDECRILCAEWVLRWAMRELELWLLGWEGVGVVV